MEVTPDDVPCILNLIIGRIAEVKRTFALVFMITHDIILQSAIQPSNQKELGALNINPLFFTIADPVEETFQSHFSHFQKPLNSEEGAQSQCFLSKNDSSG